MMEDKEFAFELLQRLCDKYNVNINRLANDWYIRLYDKDNNFITAINLEGYNLLANVTRISKLFENELL